MSKIDEFDQICLIENRNKLDGLDTSDHLDTTDEADMLHLEMVIILMIFFKSWRSWFKLSKVANLEWSLYKVGNLESSLYKVDTIDINWSKVDNLDSKLSNVEL